MLRSSCRLEGGPSSYDVLGASLSLSRFSVLLPLLLLGPGRKRGNNLTRVETGLILALVSKPTRPYLSRRRAQTLPQPLSSSYAMLKGEMHWHKTTLPTFTPMARDFRGTTRKQPSGTRRQQGDPWAHSTTSAFYTSMAWVFHEITRGLQAITWEQPNTGMYRRK